MDIVGTGFIIWVDNGIKQGLKINPFPKKFITKDKPDIIARLKEILSPTAMADVEPNKYIAFGDSITAGVGSSGEGYPPRLERKLNQNIGPSTVVNEGVGGETTIDGVNRIDGVLNSHNAKYILLLEGANDVTHSFSMETIIFNLGTMVDKSKAYGTTPFLATHTPRIDGWALRVEQDINPGIVNIANEKNIRSVDQYTEMNKSKEEYMADHVHPNDAGYELMSTIWFNAINEVVNPQSDDGGGCGTAPPVYPRDTNSLIMNLLPTLIISIFLLIRRRFSVN